MSTLPAAGENAVSPREQKVPGAGIEPARSEEQGILSARAASQCVARSRTFASGFAVNKRTAPTPVGGKKGAILAAILLPGCAGPDAPDAVALLALLSPLAGVWLLDRVRP